jgi:hypothetical protein
MGISGSLKGRRVVIGTDGGRVRIRQDKRGRRSKKGRRRGTSPGIAGHTPISQRSQQSTNLRNTGILERLSP